MKNDIFIHALPVALLYSEPCSVIFYVNTSIHIFKKS